LRELGYIEGQSIAIEYRFATGKYEALPGFAADLVRLTVDLVRYALSEDRVAAAGYYSMIDGPILSLLARSQGRARLQTLRSPHGRRDATRRVARSKSWHIDLHASRLDAPRRSGSSGLQSLAR
jgi:hypothetical protein